MLLCLFLFQNYNCQDEGSLTEQIDHFQTAPLVLETGFDLSEWNQEIFYHSLLALNSNLVVADYPQKRKEGSIDCLKFGHSVLIEEVHVLSR